MVVDEKKENGIEIYTMSSWYKIEATKYFVPSSKKARFLCSGRTISIS